MIGGLVAGWKQGKVPSLQEISRLSNLTKNKSRVRSFDLCSHGEDHDIDLCSHGEDHDIDLCSEDHDKV